MATTTRAIQSERGVRVEIEKAIEIIERKTTIPNDGESFYDIEEAYNIAIWAMEKQIPTQTEIRVNDKDIKVGHVVFSAGTKVHYCQRCGTEVSGINRYCYNCGQALIW